MERTEEVQELQNIGAAILCLGCEQVAPKADGSAPTNSSLYFGIDYSFWQIGPRFQGVKLIPPGVHYIYYGLGDGDSAGSSRSGFFAYLRPREVLVRKWDPATEEFVCLPDDEAYRYAEGVRSFDFDKTMGPYPLEYRQKWESLSCFISPEVLEKIEPVTKTIKQQSLEYDPATDEKTMRQVQEFDKENEKDVQMEDNSNTEKEETKTQNEKELESFGAYDGGAPKLFFTTIPKPKVKMNATAEEITMANIDKTDILTALFKEHNKQEELLGELQFAYASFILGQNFNGFEQWKELLAIFCKSEQAVFDKYTNTMSEFIKVFYEQLNQMPNDLFCDDLLENNFLSHCISSLLAICGDDRTSSKLKKRANHLANLVKQKFQLEGDELMAGTVNDSAEGGAFKDEDALMAHLASLGEDAPTIG